MKLIGSPTEQAFRAQLIKSNHSLLYDDDRQRLRDVLKRIFHQMRTAYVINWIPKQGEDFYEILINDTSVVKIELDQDQSREEVIAVVTIGDYLRGLKKQQQIQLAVALDLARKDLEERPRIAGP